MQTNFTNRFRSRYLLSQMTDQPQTTIFDTGADLDSASLVYLPVPWEPTVSYHRGTALGPRAILKASVQLDLDDPEVSEPYRHGLYLLEEDPVIKTLNARACELADRYRHDFSDHSRLSQINSLSNELNAIVCNQVTKWLNTGKTVGLIGGDHSVSYGAIRAMAEHFGEFGILHFDAHHDLRAAYQGFQHSHASIMHNVLNDIPQVIKLTQVGIRDYCREEQDFATGQKGRVAVFYDHAIKKRQIMGEPWHKITANIVKTLPQTVYVSFDIDGLDPKLCPNTGTPVMGGLDFHEVNHVLGELARSGRRIIGFDLVEVAPAKDNEWDANVGMRLLYKLSAWTLTSQGKAPLLFCKTS